MVKRRQVIEIFAPTLGIKSDSPTTIMDVRSQPDGTNGKMYFGFNQKEYGTTLYATGTGSAVGAPINHIFEAKFPNSNVLQVFTHTAVYKYTSGSDAFISDGQVYTGTYDDYWSSVMHNDALIFVNGVDPMQVKTAVAATATAMASAIATNTYNAWALASFREHLNLYHTIENGAEFYKRIRWSRKGVLTYSAATTDFSSGTAGAIDVQDCEGEIKGAVALGGGMAVYSERSIHVQYWVGGDEVYKFEKTVSGIGTPSRRGFAVHKDVNYFIGHENFYAYYGGDDIRDIGDPVRKIAFSNINNSALSNAFVEVDPREEEVLFHIPTGTSDKPDTVWVYRITDDCWSKLRRDYTAYGRFTRVSGLTIGELIGDIGAQNFTFGDAQISSEALTRIYGDQSGRVVKVDPTVYSVSASGTSTPQNFVYETPDLTPTRIMDPADKDEGKFTNADARWVKLRLDIVGNGTAYAYYSTDRGSTYTQLPESPVTATITGTAIEMDLDVANETIRYQVINTATNEYVGISYLATELIPQGTG